MSVPLSLSHTSYPFLYLPLICFIMSLFIYLCISVCLSLSIFLFCLFLSLICYISLIKVLSFVMIFFRLILNGSRRLDNFRYNLLIYLVTPNLDVWSIQKLPRLSCPGPRRPWGSAPGSSSRWTAPEYTKLSNGVSD